MDSVVKKINDEEYYVNKNEFDRILKDKYENLNILKNLGECERLIGLFKELSFLSNKNSNLYFVNTNHGGFLPINCSYTFEKIILFDTDQQNKKNINKNINNFKTKNIYFSNFNKIFDEFNKVELINNFNIFYCEQFKNCELFFEDFLTFFDILVLKNNIIDENNKILKYFENSCNLSNSNIVIYYKEKDKNIFLEHFKFYFQNELLCYDNLINLCIMVKNASDQFEDTLQKNYHIIDKWTILDTGSTDNTIEIIDRTIAKNKSGTLYREEFANFNFRDSRNRLLDLAGTKCKYNLMLDDTYYVDGNLREFLNEIRGDQNFYTWSLTISSKDVIYSSDRITKSSVGLRYKYKIHEVIDNKNKFTVNIPNKIKIIDKIYNFMENRSNERKKLDFKLLFEELEDNPHDPRIYYYLGQSYKLIGDYENSLKYYLKRAEFMDSGFRQELYDSLFEAGRVSYINLKKPWEFCEKIFDMAYKVDNNRNESLYLIGSHYYQNNDYEQAYKYLKLAFEIGHPTHTSFNLKPLISFHFIPKILSKLSYIVKDYKLGLNATLLFIQNNNNDAESYQEIISWHKIYLNLNKFFSLGNVINNIKLDFINKKPLFIFLADGGFKSWTGSSITKEGVGGSETYIIEMARSIQQIGNYDTIVFCNTPNKESEIFEGTKYFHLEEYFEFIKNNHIEVCLISRYSEYLPVSYEGNIENIYFIVHDLLPSGIVIPINNKLKNILCLTEWHKLYFTNHFPTLKNITTVFYHGINFIEENNIITNDQIIPYKFIYSSFPNRGLLHLLEIWTEIYSKEPRSTLHIYCDLENKWVNENYPDKIKAIKSLLSLYNKTPGTLGITLHGWVNKKILEDSWKTAEYWLYPCVFHETFCLTALECAKSKTLAITNNLAGLQDTIGERGVYIEGNPSTQEWKDKILEKVFYYFDKKNYKEKQDLVNKNYQWVTELTWTNRAKYFHLNFLSKNKFYNFNVYNWKINFEHNEFLKVISHINSLNNSLKDNKKNILEINSYNGISLIKFIKIINNSVGFLFNDFDNISKQIIFKNIKSCNDNIAKKLIFIEDKFIDSNSLLNTTKFEFISITNIKNSYNLYLNLFNSYKICAQNGIIAIDIPEVDLLNQKQKNEEFKQSINLFIDYYKKNIKLFTMFGNKIFFVKNFIINT